VVLAKRTIEAAQPLLSTTVRGKEGWEETEYEELFSLHFLWIQAWPGRFLRGLNVAHRDQSKTLSSERMNFV
jgi:hypothetical protein